MTPEEVFARKHTVLRVRTGSQLFGTSVDDKPDNDEIAIFVESYASLFDVEPNYKRPTIISSRTAGTDEFGQDKRSTEADTDATLYSLTHFIRETAKGNPNTIMVLFAPGSYILNAKPVQLNHKLRIGREHFITKAMGDRFLGYLKNQRKLYLDNPTPKRPELVKRYGFDTKGAYHALRIGLQGLSLMQDQDVILPMTHEARRYLKEVRTGGYSKGEVLDHLDTIEDELSVSIMRSGLPPKADYSLLKTWNRELHQLYWDYQERHGTFTPLNL